MKVIVGWDNEAKTILRFHFSEDWEWNEFQAALQEAESLLASVGHMVDVIADFQGSNRVPTETLARLAYVGSPCPINMGNIVLVGSKLFATTTLAIFQTFYGKVAQTFEFTHSLERARALLAKAGIRYPVGQKVMFA